MFSVCEEGCPESFDARLAALETAVAQVTLDSKQNHDRLEVMIDTSAANICNTKASLKKLGCNFVSYQQDLVKILQSELVKLAEKMQEQESVLRALVDEAATSLSSTQQQITVEINTESEWWGMQESLRTARQCILDIHKEEGSPQEAANTSRPTENSEIPMSLTSMLSAASKDIGKVQADLRVALEARQCVYTERQTTAQGLKAKTKDAQPSPASLSQSNGTKDAQPSPVSLSQSNGATSVIKTLWPANATTKDAQPSPVSLSQSNGTTSVIKPLWPANVIQPTKLRPTSSPSRTPSRQSLVRSTPANRHAYGTYFSPDSSANAPDNSTAAVSQASEEKAKRRPSKESELQSPPIRFRRTSTPQHHGPQAWMP